MKDVKAHGCSVSVGTLVIFPISSIRIFFPFVSTWLDKNRSNAPFFLSIEQDTLRFFPSFRGRPINQKFGQANRTVDLTWRKPKPTYYSKVITPVAYFNLMNLNPLPDKLLSDVKNITLEDLLRSPTFRPFVLSALGNGVSINQDCTDLNDKDEMFFKFTIDQVIKRIPEDDRRDYFYESGRLIREHKAQRDERQNRNTQSSALRHLPVKYQWSNARFIRAFFLPVSWSHTMKIYEIDFCDEIGSQATFRCEANNLVEARAIADKFEKELRTENFEDSWRAYRIKMLFAFKK